MRPGRRRQRVTPDSPWPAGAPAIRTATRRRDPNRTSSAEWEPDRPASRTRATHAKEHGQRGLSHPRVSEDHQSLSRQFAKLLGHVGDAVGPAAEPRPATADQRTQRIRVGDVPGAVRDVHSSVNRHRTVSGPGSSNCRTMISFRHWARYQSGQLTPGRVHLRGSGSRRGRGRRPARPSDQPHRERCQTGDKSADLGR
jgi:hypothetical protein